jgi:hypothetical protein
MNETRLPAAICEYLDGSDCGIRFVPEVWRDGFASVWLTGGGKSVREYVDGSSIAAVPFEIRLRIEGESIADRLDAVAIFAKIDEYAKIVPVGEEAYVKQTSGAVKSAVYDDGSEEYRAAYELRYLKNAPSMV